MRALVIALLLINHSSFALGSKWSETQAKKIEDVDRLSKIEQIEILGQIASIGSNHPLDREAQAVFERSQSLLLSMDQIEKYPIKERIEILGGSQLRVTTPFSIQTPPKSSIEPSKCS